MARKTYIDWLRIFAIILVIYNHTRAKGFELFLVTDDKVSYTLSFMMYPICKIAVPIFLMISGVTLLSKKEMLKDLYKKRVLKYLILILIFGTLQFLRYIRVGKVPLSLTAWFTSIYSVPILETYWFLYLYLGFLLILPLLRKVTSVIEKQEYLYLFILCNIFQLLYCVGYFTGYYINGNIFSFSINIFYPLMGFGINKYCENIKVRFIILLTVLSEIFIVVIGLLYIKKFPDSQENVVSVFQLFIPLLSIEIFMIFKVGCNKKKSKLVRIIGQAVFGIYLIEDMVRNQVEKMLYKVNFHFVGSEFVFCMIFVFVSFAISLLIVIGFRKIFCKKNELFNKICDRMSTDN